MPRNTRRSPTLAAMAAQAKINPSQSDRWEVAYFKRHKSDDASEIAPGQNYLKNDCPIAVSAHMRAVVVQVAGAPPDKFAGGGYWEAMHGAMTGYFEVRKKYRGNHYRLFCVLDEESKGTKPLLTILCGMTKPDRTTFSDADYAWVRDMGEEYRSRNPRSVS
jgi:hypothetical protein